MRLSTGPSLNPEREAEVEPPLRNLECRKEHGFSLVKVREDGMRNGRGR